MLALSVAESPIGPLTVAVRDGRVSALFFGDSEAAVLRALARWHPAEAPHHAGDPAEDGPLRALLAALASYFDGDVHALDSVPVELNGTPFQVRVWNALREVAPGRTASYGEIARRIGAASAVGAANGANPVAIIIPCHRIVGADGSLTGYGGGLDRKRWLLAHERLALAAGQCGVGHARVKLDERAPTQP